MKELERFLIIGWVVGEEFVRENSDNKTSQLHTLYLVHQGKIEAVGPKGRISEKRRKFKIFKLVKVKRNHLRPIKIYSKEKTQLVQKLYFCYYYYYFNLKKALISVDLGKQKKKATLMCICCITSFDKTERSEKDLLCDIQ